MKAGKWVWNVGLPAIDPMKAFVNFMDWINNSTPETRQKMSDLGIPDFGVGGTVNLDGNVNAKGSIMGHEVFNTANIDRSGPSVKATNKMLTNVRQDYGQAWQAASNGGGLGTASMVFGASGVVGDIASMSNSTFRLTNGVANGSMLSTRIYGSGWNGGSAAGITTYSLSKVGGAVSFGSSIITTGNAYYDIATGQQQPITYLDAVVGTTGIMSTVGSYYTGVQIPYIGEGVAVYGTLRLTWDVFYYLGANYGPIGAYYGTNRWSGR